MSVPTASASCSTSPPTKTIVPLPFSKTGPVSFPPVPKQPPSSSTEHGGVIVDRRNSRQSGNHPETGLWEVRAGCHPLGRLTLRLLVVGQCPRKTRCTFLPSRVYHCRPASQSQF